MRWFWSRNTAVGLLRALPFLGAAFLLSGCTALNGSPREYQNSLEMRFALIPGGSFSMGSEDGEPDESPVHEVHVDSFYLSVFEVTAGEFAAVMGLPPPSDDDEGLPASHVSWWGAEEFCDRLSEMEGHRYRLPTEAEWEFAASGRGGKPEFLWGDSALPVREGIPQANVADISLKVQNPEIGSGNGYQEGYDDGFPILAPVGSFPPNDYGLHDLAGNAFEWVQDWYQEFHYASSAVENPRGPDTPDYRGGKVLRGGSWYFSNRYFRTTGRFQAPPDTKAIGIGFRVVREIEKGGKPQ